MHYQRKVMKSEVIYESFTYVFDLVVLYRDGVSDGQLAIVAEHELPQIIDTFPKIMPGYQ